MPYGQDVYYFSIKELRSRIAFLLPVSSAQLILIDSRKIYMWLRSSSIGVPAFKRIALGSYNIKLFAITPSKRELVYAAT